MIEVFPNLFVGDQNDLIHVDDGNKGVKDGWFVISAAKDPWHREALGYSGRAAPKDHAEYLIAARDRRLILNLIDANDPAYVPDKIVDTTLEMIDASLAGGLKVLIHCNQGQSRAPTLALLWIHRNSPLYSVETFDEAVEDFRKVYPTYAPAKGMAEYARTHWEKQHVDA